MLPSFYMDSSESVGMGVVDTSIPPVLDALTVVKRLSEQEEVVTSWVSVSRISISKIGILLRGSFQCDENVR